MAIDPHEHSHIDDMDQDDVHMPVLNIPLRPVPQIPENLPIAYISTPTIETESLPEASQTPLHRNSRQRKSANLTNVLQKIMDSNIQPVDQAKILRKSLENSVSHTVMDNLMVPAAESENETKLLTGVLDYLSRLNLRNNQNRKIFYDLVTSVCSIEEKDIGDEDFMKWLCKRIKKRYDRIMQSLKSHVTGNDRRKLNAILPIETRQKIFDTWHEHSIFTVDRRNGRDQVVIKQQEYAKRYNDLTLPNDIKLNYTTNKRNQEIVQGTRQIATKTGHQIKAKLEKSGFNVSYGTVYGPQNVYLNRNLSSEFRK